MKNALVFFFCCVISFLWAQENPTIAVCTGNQYVCATSNQMVFCVKIKVDPNYGNLAFISHFTIDWGDGTQITTVPGSPNPPNQSHTYDLTGFYGTCQPSKEYTIKLLTYHTNGALPANSAFFLTFTNPPIAGIGLSDMTVCTDQNVTIFDQSCPPNFTNPTWNFGDGITATGTLSNTHAYSTAGTYTITHSVTNTCGSDTKTVNISVINPAIANVQVDSGALSGTPPVICLGGGGLVRLDGSISLNETSYMWTVSPSTGWQWWPLPFPVPTGPKPRIKFTQAGLYTITLKVNNDCNMPNTKVITVKVVEAPLLNLNHQPSDCQPISYTPSPLTPNATYTINGATQTTFPVMLPLSNNPYIVVASLTNECGMQVRQDSFTLKLPENITINAPVSNMTVCSGSAPIILNASPAGGVWSGPNISQSGGNTLFTPPGTAGVFTLRYSKGQGICERHAEVIITVEQSYPLALTPQPDVCNSIDFKPAPFDNNVQYSINGVVQTQWPTNLTLSSNPYIVTATVTNTCGSKMLSDTFRVVGPESVSILSPPHDTIVCQNSGPLSLSASPLDGNWLGSNISGPSNNTVFNPNSTGIFPIIYRKGPGVCERSDTVVIKVEEAYNLQLAPQPDDCISLNYSPMPNDPAVSYSINGASQTAFPIMLSASGAPFIITAMHSNVCGIKTLSDTFYLRTPTEVNILWPLEDTIVCQNSGAIALSAAPSGGTWMGSNISADSVFNPVAGGTFLLIYSRGSGNCEKQDSTQITVISVNIEAGLDQSHCLDDASFTLPGFSPPGGIWTGNGITSTSGMFSPGTAGVGAHTLSYEVIDTVLGCKFRDTINMRVNPMPLSSFVPPSQTCVGEEIQFQNTSQNTHDVLWDFGDGGTSILPNPKHTYLDSGIFTIKLRTVTEFNCMDMTSQTVFVTRPPVAFFSPMPDTGCAVLNVSFTNKSYGYQTSYQWDFGNGQSESQYNPALQQYPGGTKDTTYVITLSASNLCATRTWTDSILVHPLPIVRFGTQTDTICSGDFILLANTTQGNPETFAWTFGNGITSGDSLPAPVQYFTDSLFRTYTIQLISTNFCGADTASHDITIKPVSVRAFFNVPNYEGCQPYTVSFNNFSTPGANVYWQFGDGNTSAFTAPIHTFQNPGIFKVVQKASDGCGFDSTFALITVLPAPLVSFSSAPQICRNDTLQFTNTSVSPLSGLHWQFGDGDTSVLNNPKHVFKTAGVKTVTLTGISAENGCPGSISKPVLVLELPSVAFSFNPPDGCMPLDVKFQNQSQGSTYYEWDFGDGNTKNGPAPSHTYQLAGQYEVELKAIDINGCRNDSTFRYITVHPIPSPAFDYQRDHLCGLPVLVSFVNQTPDAISYSWLFGDNTGPSVQNNPQHTYLLPGDYTVQLIAENTFGCRDTTAKTFVAYAQPVADFTPEPLEGCSPLKVVFENFSTDDTAAKWYFSDGGASDSLAQTTHIFWQPGQYNATLVAIHRDVCFDTLTLNNAVNVKPSPTANFSFSEIVTDPPSGMFQFTDLSIGAARWHWDFGDGHSSSLQNPEHRYYSNQPKTVRLTVFAANDCPDDTTMIVTPHDIRGLFLPSAFTPSLGNGLAAVFQPAGAGLKAFEVEVFSSYGQLLWRSDKLLEGQPAEFWDGTYQGVLQPEDVYTWQVRVAIFEDGTSWEGKRVGSVTLIR